MSDADKTSGSQWSLWSRTQRTAIEWLAVIISMLGFLTTVLVSIIAAIISGVAIWLAYDAAEEAEISSMYIVELHACLKSKECNEIPPIPEELLQ